MASNRGTVQTLLSTRKVNTNKSSSEKPSKEAKRTHSDVSMDSSIDLAVIQNDLEAIKGKLEKVVKKNDLDQLSQSLVKKSDIELIVTSIVNTKLMDNFKKELDEKLKKKFIEKTGKQQKTIEELTKENEQLREITVEQRRTINSLKNGS